MRFAAAANVASAPSGMLIPPSNTTIVYALVSQASVGALFLAGYIPGFCCGPSPVASSCGGTPARTRSCAAAAGRPPRKPSSRSGVPLPSLGLIIIVIGGIIIGFFTPTEGAAIAVLYAASSCRWLYRNDRHEGRPEDPARRDPHVLGRHLPDRAQLDHELRDDVLAHPEAASAKWLVSVTDSKVVFLLIMMVMLLIIGIPLDATPAVLIFTPIFLPIAVQYYDIHPVHFGMMMVFNMGIAVISPPSAPVLFVGARVAGQKVENVIKPLMPFFIALIVMLLIIQFVPELSLWLPRQAWASIHDKGDRSSRTYEAIRDQGRRGRPVEDVATPEPARGPGAPPRPLSWGSAVRICTTTSTGPTALSWCGSRWLPATSCPRWSISTPAASWRPARR
jgi:TRAP-type C4-dicarboxylate transport system permease large subunit